MLLIQSKTYLRCYLIKRLAMTRSLYYSILSLYIKQSISLEKQQKNTIFCLINELHNVFQHQLDFQGFS